MKKVSEILQTFCYRCEQKQPGPYVSRQPPLCLANNKPMQENAASKECPLGKFTLLTISAKATKTGKAIMLPSMDEQRDWQARAINFCMGCKHYRGTTFDASQKLAFKIRCGGCQTCGAKTVSAVQDCPMGLFHRVTVNSAMIAANSTS